MQKIFASIAIAACSLAASLGATGPALAQDNGLGSELFETSCAICHGTDGRGHGEFGDVLTVAPPDLTLLSENNDGVFPYLRVFQTVDGRTQIRAHGVSMPIWGDVFARELGETGGPYGQELIIRARMMALVDYVESLQAM